MVKSLVQQEFGESGTYTGNEIKEKLSRVFSKLGKNPYVTIRTLEKYGYILEKRKENNHFIYDIFLT